MLNKKKEEQANQNYSGSEEILKMVEEERSYRNELCQQKENEFGTIEGTYRRNLHKQKEI